MPDNGSLKIDLVSERHLSGGRYTANVETERLYFDFANACAHLTPQTHLKTKLPVFYCYTLDLVVLAQIESIHIVVLLKRRDQWNKCIQWLESWNCVTKPIFTR